MTPQLAAASLYAGLLILFAIALQARVILQRRSKLIGIGDGKDHDLIRAIRVHGNFIENVPFALIGLVLLALTAHPVWLIHGLGIILIGARIGHAVGLTHTAGKSTGRVLGVVLTNAVLIISAGALILAALR